MQYFDKDFNSIECPYGLSFLDSYLPSTKTATIMPIHKYQNNIENTDIVIAYEWSGQTPVPAEIPANHFILYFDFVNDNSNVIYYPQWLFFVAAQQKTFNEIKTTYPVACASRNFNNGRPGKIYNYQQLKHKSYFDKLLITKYKSIEEFETYAIQDMISDDMLTEFLLDYNTWPTMIGNNLDLVSSMTVIDLPVYTNSLFHLIAETTVNHYSLSEKTYKVFLSGQIPIMCGPQYAVKHLRELGFDMFDDIVNHGRYDSIANWQQRIDQMHICVDEILALDHENIKHKTADRRLANFNLLKSNEFHKSILEPISCRIS